VAEERRARYIGQLFDLLGERDLFGRDFRYVKGLYLYELRDATSSGGYPPAGANTFNTRLGLLKHDFTPTPSFDAFKQGIRRTLGPADR
jgi:hypothetical protein